MKKRIGQVLAMLGGTAVALAAMFLVDKVILGAREADAKVNAYEEAHNRHPEEISMKYDWYSGSGYISDNYNYNPEKDIIFDKEYNELWYKFFDDKMEEVKSSMDYSVIIEDYSLITYFDGTDATTRYDDLFVYGVYNAQPVAEEKRVEAGAEIIMEIISEMDLFYNFCGVHIDYYDLSGVYRYSISMDKEKITKEMLMENATEVSFDGNLEIEEKWEAFCDQRITFWTLDVDGYEVSLVGMDEYDDYYLMCKDETGERILESYYHYDVENPYEDYDFGTFENILGYSGFYVYEMHHFSTGTYYAIVDGDVVNIARSWGNSVEDCYSVDMDEDGITELVCNVMWGDGARHAIVYHNNDSVILEGNVCDLLDIEYDHVNYMSEYCWYVPEENVVEIYYWLDALEEWEYEKYEIDLSKIRFLEYAKQESFELDGYQISLERIEQGVDYQLIMRGNGSEEVIETLDTGIDDGKIGKYNFEYFEDVLGCSGFTFDVIFPEFEQRKYYTIINGEPICIASAYLTENQSSFEEICVVTDINGDGVTELIVNEEEILWVNGIFVNLEEKFVSIYMRDNDEILIGYGGAMQVWDLDYYYPKYLESWYLPETNKLVKKYYDADGNIFEEEYDINLDKIYFEQFVYVN